MLVTGTLTIVGWYKSINLLLLLGYGLFILFLINALIARRTVQKLTAIRNSLEPVFAGETVVLRFNIITRARWPVYVTIRDEADGKTSNWFLCPLMPHKSEMLSFRTQFSLRGVHPVGPIRAECGYPFGLIYATRQIAENGEAIVLPELGTINLQSFRRWLIRGGAGDESTRKSSPRIVPGTGDVRGLRPYRTGDPPRDIHWRTSARRGQLLVREYDNPNPLDLILLLDRWIPAEKCTASDLERLEWVISLAATLIQTWANEYEGSFLNLIIPGQTVGYWRTRCSVATLRQSLVPLAMIQGISESPLIDSHAILSGSNRVARIIITTRTSSPYSNEFAKAGRPFAVVGPDRAPIWYDAPRSLKS